VLLRARLHLLLVIVLIERLRLVVLLLMTIRIVRALRLRRSGTTRKRVLLGLPDQPRELSEWIALGCARTTAIVPSANGLGLVRISIRHLMRFPIRKA
jgi:hypothetical protein